MAMKLAMMIMAFDFLRCGAEEVTSEQSVRNQVTSFSSQKGGIWFSEAVTDSTVPNFLDRLRFHQIQSGLITTVASPKIYVHQMKLEPILLDKVPSDSFEGEEHEPMKSPSEDAEIVLYDSDPAKHDWGKRKSESRRKGKLTTTATQITPTITTTARSLPATTTTVPKTTRKKKSKTNNPNLSTEQNIAKTVRLRNVTTPSTSTTKRRRKHKISASRVKSGSTSPEDGVLNSSKKAIRPVPLVTGFITTTPTVTKTATTPSTTSITTTPSITITTTTSPTTNATAEIKIKISNIKTPASSDDSQRTKIVASAEEPILELSSSNELSTTTAKTNKLLNDSKELLETPSAPKEKVKILSKEVDAKKINVELIDESIEKLNITIPKDTTKGETKKQDLTAPVLPDETVSSEDSSEPEYFSIEYDSFENEDFHPFSTSDSYPSEAVWALGEYRPKLPPLPNYFPRPVHVVRKMLFKTMFSDQNGDDDSASSEQDLVATFQNEDASTKIPPYERLKETIANAEAFLSYQPNFEEETTTVFATTTKSPRELITRLPKSYLAPPSVKTAAPVMVDAELNSDEKDYYDMVMKSLNKELVKVIPANKSSTSTTTEKVSRNSNRQNFKDISNDPLFASTSVNAKMVEKRVPTNLSKLGKKKSKRFDLREYGATKKVKAIRKLPRFYDIDFFEDIFPLSSRTYRRHPDYIDDDENDYYDDYDEDEDEDYDYTPSRRNRFRKKNRGRTIHRHRYHPHERHRQRDPYDNEEHEPEIEEQSLQREAPARPSTYKPTSPPPPPTSPPPPPTSPKTTTTTATTTTTRTPITTTTAIPMMPFIPPTSVPTNTQKYLQHPISYLLSRVQHGSSSPLPFTTVARPFFTTQKPQTMKPLQLTTIPSTTPPPTTTTTTLLTTAATVTEETHESSQDKFEPTKLKSPTEEEESENDYDDYEATRNRRYRARRPYPRFRPPPPPTDEDEDYEDEEDYPENYIYDDDDEEESPPPPPRPRSRHPKYKKKPTPRPMDYQYDYEDDDDDDDELTVPTAKQPVNRQNKVKVIKTYKHTPQIDKTLKKERPMIYVTKKDPAQNEIKHGSINVPLIPVLNANQPDADKLPTQFQADGQRKVHRILNNKPIKVKTNGEAHYEIQVQQDPLKPALLINQKEPRIIYQENTFDSGPQQPKFYVPQRNGHRHYHHSNVPEVIPVSLQGKVYLMEVPKDDHQNPQPLFIPVSRTVPQPVLKSLSFLPVKNDTQNGNNVLIPQTIMNGLPFVNPTGETGRQNVQLVLSQIPSEVKAKQNNVGVVGFVSTHSPLQHKEPMAAVLVSEPMAILSTPPHLTVHTSPQPKLKQYKLVDSTPPIATKNQVIPCDASKCRLPSCFCGSNKVIPGNLKPEEIPQMILLTFDDSINDINFSFYQMLFNSGFKNPNGCPMRGTFYVSHEWTDYGKIQTLNAFGHEIASHSISHSDGANFSKKRWKDEIYGQKEILSHFGGIPLAEIKGMRAPFLQLGGDIQFEMLYETNFTYDSSIPVRTSDPPFWPYTFDYGLPHECNIPPCPKGSYPGLWEVPLVMWTDLQGGRCSMADACTNSPTAEGIFEMLMSNFERHYHSNRAPFGMYYHYAWFTQPHHLKGFKSFLEVVMQLKEVYFVTTSQMLDWMRQPTPLNQLNSFTPWKCKHRIGSGGSTHICPKSKSCSYKFSNTEKTLQTCKQCPPAYPWLGNPHGLKLAQHDNKDTVVNRNASITNESKQTSQKNVLLGNKKSNIGNSITSQDNNKIVSNNTNNAQIMNSAKKHVTNHQQNTNNVQ